MHETLLLIVPAAYGVLSLVSFIVYALDKAAARRGDRRFPENTLHLLDLLGGWPGAWLAQKTFRHKTGKRLFQRMYKFTIVLNIVLAGCLLFSL